MNKLSFLKLLTALVKSTLCPVIAHIGKKGDYNFTLNNESTGSVL